MARECFSKHQTNKGQAERMIRLYLAVHTSIVISCRHCQPTLLDMGCHLIFLGPCRRHIELVSLLIPHTNHFLKHLMPEALVTVKSKGYTVSTEGRGFSRSKILSGTICPGAVLLFQVSITNGLHHQDADRLRKMYVCREHSWHSG